jgi:hypothetical protein
MNIWNHSNISIISVQKAVQDNFHTPYPQDNISFDSR